MVFTSSGPCVPLDGRKACSGDTVTTTSAHRWQKRYAGKRVPTERDWAVMRGLRTH